MKNRKIDKAIGDKIIQLHLQGKNTVEIENITGFDNTTIGRFLTKNGYNDRQERWKLTRQQRDEILNRYSQGETSLEIFQDYKSIISCQETIQYLVRKKGKQRRKGNRNVLDENYFSKIDSPQKAYVLGLLTADGNVSEKKGNKQRTIQFSQSSPRENLVKFLKEELKTDNSITKIKRKNSAKFQYGLHVSSDTMAKDLEKYNILPRKSLVLSTVPNLQEELFSYYLRGFFDGNGTVYKTGGKIRCGFYSTYSFLESIQEILCDRYGIKKRKITKMPTNEYLLGFWTKEEIEKIYSIMYKNEFHVCAEDKKDKFEM